MKLTRWFIILALALVTTLARAQETNSSEQLTQWVGQLQKSPTDRALREKIIKLALELQPAPAVPPEARRPFVMGVTYQKEAKSPEDFGLAVKAFQDASAAAPWWGDAYYNLSVALESAKRYDEAKDALTLYLLTKPTDAEQAQERLYALDAKKVLAGKQAAITAQAEADKKAEDEKARSELAAKQRAEVAKPDFSGKWEGPKSWDKFFIEKDGDSWIVRDNNRKLLSLVKAQGRQLWVESYDSQGWNTVHYEFVLSENGQTIDEARKYTQSTKQFNKMKRDDPVMSMGDLGVYKHYVLRRSPK